MELKKVVQDLKVVENVRLNKRHFILELLAPEKFPLILPGQFVQALVKDSPSTFLRRPFSVHSVDYIKNTLRLLIQIKGEGTRHLAELKTGDELNLIYPLGNSFSLPVTKNVLLVGGGCGVAPLLFLAKFLNQNNIHPTILLGFRTKEEVSEIEDYSRCGKTLVITDDGTEGEKGLVTDHSIFQREQIQFKKIYCCGPDAMMKAVAKIARMHHADCEVSLENTMACGFGVCLCCITPTDKGNERVCVEGPVFNINKLKW
ncbi:MAG: dihydroorotate dehydrogenase electron transfer subunit [Bacteroidales bacterium]|nr:dihydroorotate dehydrogenase electron transfer subunit [Bacteroidales bacterium]